MQVDLFIHLPDPLQNSIPSVTVSRTCHKALDYIEPCSAFHQVAIQVEDLKLTVVKLLVVFEQEVGLCANTASKHPVGADLSSA